jgi:hypothetical protein
MTERQFARFLLRCHGPVWSHSQRDVLDLLSSGRVPDNAANRYVLSHLSGVRHPSDATISDAFDKWATEAAAVHPVFGSHLA